MPRISGLPTLTTVAADDYLLVYDRSDTSGSSTGTTKKMTVQEFGDTLPVGSVSTITAGTGISVSLAIPSAPVVALSAGSQSSLALANTALQNITGYIEAGSNVTITGSGTLADPYEIAASGGGSGIGGSTGSNDNRILRADGTGGSTLQASAVSIDDSGNVFGLGTLNTMTIPAATGTIALGTGVSGRIAYWNSANSITSNADLTYAGGALTLGITGGVTPGSLTMAGNSSGTTTLQPSAAASGTLTLPAATDTLVGRATTDTLTNKTITAPVFSGTFSGTYELGGTPTFGSLNLGNLVAGRTYLIAGASTGTVNITMPTATDTLVGRASTDTLTNKTLTSPVLTTPNLGTPSAVTLTNGTGLPISGLVSSTSTALGVGSLELGNASDTTLSRAAAGDLAVEGVSVLTTSNAKTVTNKREQPRTASSTTASNLSPDLATANVYYRTTQTATLTIDAPTGTPVIGETIAIYVDSAGAQTLTINSTYKAFGSAFPATTTAGKTFMLVAQYNGTDWKATWANAV